MTELIRQLIGNKRLALMFMTFVSVLAGCQRFGPAPETVSFVDVPRYMGVWNEIASNPQFFNADLVGVTATYTLRDDGKVTVSNRGHKGTIDGPETSIEGVARVVDATTNSKLGVQFSSVPFSALFEGEYWIVSLAPDYEYAVVTDSRQSTLFILSRAATMSKELYRSILADLSAKRIDVSRLRITGILLDS